MNFISALAIATTATNALSYVCNYDIFPPSYTHYLYKEEDLPIVKWLPKEFYCKDKGDPRIYIDAGQPKCEYSRGICKWDYEANTCIDTSPPNDSQQTCIDLLEQNTLADQLDDDRLPFTPLPPFSPEPSPLPVSASDSYQIPYELLILITLIQ